MTTKISERDRVTRFAASADVDASPERVWAVMVDVAAMPDWTASITSLRLEPAGPLAVGSVAEIVQPRLGKARWTVTEYTPGTSFAWVSRRPGIATTGIHALASSATGTTVTLTVEHRGPLAKIATRFTAALTRRYLELEATGLKQASEQLG